MASPPPPPWHVPLAGGVAGLVVDLVLFPLDTIKTRLQARPPRAPFHAASFYRGLASAMAGSFPAAATFWTAYEAGRAALAPPLDALGLGALAPAGGAAAAELAVVAVRNPFEVVKQQLQAGLHGARAGSADAARRILREQGLRGFYAGYASTVLREIPFDAIEFSLYERLKAARERERAEAEAERERAGGGAGAGGGGARRGAKVELLWWENALAGCAAGAVAAAVTTPLDVVKTRLMTQRRLQQMQAVVAAPAEAASAAAAAAAAPPRLAAAAAAAATGVQAEAAQVLYTGWADALRRIYAEEGFRALFSGLVPRVTWIAMGGAVFIGSFEELKRRLGKQD